MKIFLSLSKDKVEAKYEAVSDWKKYFEEIKNTHYNYFVLGFEDVDSLKTWGVELEDRYSATRQIGGRLFGYLSGVVGDVTEEASIIYKAEKVNSPHIILLPYTNIASLQFSFVTKIAGVAITALSNDPAANTYSLAVNNLFATSEISSKERDSLLFAGVATFTLDYENNIRIERLVTSYKRNSNGERDTSYLDIQVVETVDAIRTYINDEAKKRFKGWKLANTEEWFGSGSKVMTPSVFKSFLADLYRTVFIEKKQWTQDFDSYKKSLKAEVKTDIKTRLEYSHSPVLIGQFYQAFGVNQFK